VLSVSDTGIGMDKATQTRIFEPFFTTKESGKGTGLGLSTAFGIVKQSGGSIWVYSEVGVGTTFSVFFPRVDANSERPGEAQQEQQGDEVILLVEDDVQVRAVASNILRRVGYQVLEAQDLRQALAYCEQSDLPIDLLLTDVVMPGASGRVVAEQVAALRRGIKVLFMSGYTNDAVLRHGVVGSGMAFLQKPLTSVALTRKIREVLDAEASAPDKE
jgi:two-component system, cell cycle sensor histidine kinase and response regulator CckA